MVLTTFMAARSGSVSEGASPPMRIWACAPGTVSTARADAGAGAGVALGAGADAAGSAPKSPSALATNSALFTFPLTASTIAPGT